MENDSVKEQVATANPTEQAKVSDKEMNFANLRRDRERAEMLLNQEREARLALQNEMENLKRQVISRHDEEDEDDSDDEYVNSKKLKKTLSKFEHSLEKKAEERARQIVENERKKDFLVRLRSEHRDFDEVLTQDTADKLQETDPELANMILNVPDEYERRKLAYKMIKNLGLHKKADPRDSIAAKVEKNAQNPYYHPASQGVAPTMSGDFSPAGRKAAYEKMKAMQRAPLSSR